MLLSDLDRMKRLLAEAVAEGAPVFAIDVRDATTLISLARKGLAAHDGEYDRLLRKVVQQKEEEDRKLAAMTPTERADYIKVWAASSAEALTADGIAIDRDLERALAAPPEKPAARDRTEVERIAREINDALSQRVARQTIEIADLRMVIRNAPHAFDCATRLHVCIAKSCTCWKREFADPMPSVEEFSAAPSPAQPTEEVRRLREALRLLLEWADWIAAKIHRHPRMDEPNTGARDLARAALNGES